MALAGQVASAPKTSDLEMERRGDLTREVLKLESSIPSEVDRPIDVRPPKCQQFRRTIP